MTEITTSNGRAVAQQERSQLTDFQVLELLRDGGNLRYFFLEGGVAMHGSDGSPNQNAIVNVTTFLGLRERGFIETRGKEDIIGGYPYYANNHKSQVYRISRQGLEHLTSISQSSAA